MQQFQKILVGVDLSRAEKPAASELNAPTQQAVNRALWLAEKLSAQVTFLAAVETLSDAGVLLQDARERAEHQAGEQARAVLDELVAAAAERNIQASATVQFGRAWEVICKEVQRNGHNLVVVGTRELGRARRLLFGSTGMKLLRYCPCPVLVTRPEEVPDEFNVLVASDFSEVSGRAIDLAVDWAQLTGAKLHLLHALDTHMADRLALTGMHEDEVHKFRGELKEQAEHKLYDQLSMTDYRTLEHGVQVEVIAGPPDVVIPEAIDEHNIDLLVMGMIARTGIFRFLIGNTAEQVLPLTKCSVLAVKPVDFQCPVQPEE